jgi:tRNA threonylcarbamoyladenosine biosynthesis protein TsaE
MLLSQCFYNELNMTTQPRADSRHSQPPEERRRLGSQSPADTAAIAERLGSLLEAGDVILLQGDLGAGKTCFAQGLARGLGVDDPVCSPTFVLVGEYAGRLRMYHADLYRLESRAEVDDLDLARSTEEGVLVVEWPERAPESLPHYHLLIRIAHVDETARSLDLLPRGRRAEQLVALLGGDVAIAG